MRCITSGVSFGDDVGRAEVFLDLGDARGAGDDGRDVRIARAPRDRELRERAAEVLGDGIELRHDLVLRLVGEALDEELHARDGAAAAGRNAVAILSGEQPRGERAPRREAQADVLVEARVFALDALAVEEVVLGLLHHGLAQVVALGDLPRRHDLGRAPFGGAPVERLAALDHVVHRPHRLLDRRVGIGPVAIDEVDVVELQALERAVDRVHQVLAVERALLVGPVGDAPEELGRDDQYFRRGQASFFSASPMISSLLPAAYTSALSKKFTPGSHAAAMHSRAAPVSSWLPYVTHEPNESSLTLRPERPSRR